MTTPGFRINHHGAGEGSKSHRRGGASYFNPDVARLKYQPDHPNHQPDIHEDLIDPCKVFVSNLRPQVSESMLMEALSHYASVVKATIIRDKNRRSKCFGFVKVKTQDDVDKLVNLCDGTLYLQGRRMNIMVARKKISMPGDHSYVRQPLPDRPFDLSQPDPSQPSIHMLVDDVMFKIFSYLPLKTLVSSEIVCRRWQMLVHRQFSRMTSLEISENSLEIRPPFTKAIVSKLLILAGPNLKSLKVQHVDFATKRNILKIISQLCPVLEVLDVTKAQGISFHHLSDLAGGCTQIKSFTAKNCIDFDERALRLLLNSYPHLQKLNVIGTTVQGKCYRLLPNTMKELYIERLDDMCNKEKRLAEIAERCPNLEVMEMKDCLLTASELRILGHVCTSLHTLSVDIACTEDSLGLSSFKNLRNLTLISDFVEHNTLFKQISNIEELSLDTREVESDTDFAILENLRVLRLMCAVPQRTALPTLAKCKKLEELHLLKCHIVSEEDLVDVIKKCPKIKKLAGPSIQVTPNFMKALDEIMKDRSGKLTLVVQDSYHNVQYNTNKIHLDCSLSHPFLHNPFSYDSDDSDYSDSSFNYSWYDSDVDFDFGDHYLFDDDDINFHDDFLDAAVMLAAWNMHDQDEPLWSV